MRGNQVIWLFAIWLTSCGGTATQAEEPSPLEEEEAFMNQPEGDPDPNNQPPTLADKREQEAEQKRKEQADKKSVKPEFKENSSVEEAIKAVPPGAERMNMDQDALAEPLKDMKLYEPCKPRPADHAKIRIAVWEGKAVGVDIETTPKNQKLADCINQQIRQLTWRDSVPSLNTIEFGF